jgi:hypothetical protein
MGVARRMQHPYQPIGALGMKGARRLAKRVDQAVRQVGRGVGHGAFIGTRQKARCAHLSAHLKNLSTTPARAAYSRAAGAAQTSEQGP